MSDIPVAAVTAFKNTIEGISAMISKVRVDTPDLAELVEFRKLDEILDQYQRAADWIEDQDYTKYTTVKVNPLYNIDKCDILI